MGDRHGRPGAVSAPGFIRRYRLKCVIVHLYSRRRADTDVECIKPNNTQMNASFLENWNVSAMA